MEDLAERGYFGDELEGAENIEVSEFSPTHFEVEAYVDGTINVSFLPAEKVAASKLVVAWDTEEPDLDELLSNYVELPPPEIVSELDLSTVGDANLILNLWTVLNDSTRVTAAQKKKFVEHIPASFATVPDIFELMGQERLPFEDDLVAEAL